jgi:hypothetical protein
MANQLRTPYLRPSSSFRRRARPLDRYAAEMRCGVSLAGRKVCVFALRGASRRAPAVTGRSWPWEWERKVMRSWPSRLVRAAPHLVRPVPFDAAASRSCCTRTAPHRNKQVRAGDKAGCRFGSLSANARGYVTMPRARARWGRARGYSRDGTARPKSGEIPFPLVLRAAAP